MEIAEFKPVLTTLLLPPAGPLLLASLGLLLSASRRWFGGALLCMLGLSALWFLSCNAVATGLAQALLPRIEPLTVRALEARKVQAIVVLGGGVLPRAPEYGQPQPAASTLARLRYGVWLARQSGKPLGFAGGVGWAAAGMQTVPEAVVAQRVASEEYGLQLRWLDDRSRDTEGNAQRMAALMKGDRIRRIALVTDASHLPRAMLEFQRAGFEVVPAPTGFAVPRERALMEWLPSGHGLQNARSVLREWLALKVART